MGGPLKLKFANHLIIYRKRPLRGLLGLAGYTQSSGTGELIWYSSSVFVSIQNLDIPREIEHEGLFGNQMIV